MGLKVPPRSGRLDGGAGPGVLLVVALHKSVEVRRDDASALFDAADLLAGDVERLAGVVAAELVTDAEFGHSRLVFVHVGGDLGGDPVSTAKTVDEL